MTTFVLVHGAFASAAELAPVIPELEALGHRAIGVDLPGTNPAATLDDYAHTVVEAMAGGLGATPVEIAAEHGVFNSRPRELAALLVR